MTAQPSPKLPPEVWNDVFGYLSAADKFAVRASCKYFQKLVDHSSLWKGWTVVLGFPNGFYNSQFWATLRRRKVSSVVVRSNKAKYCKQLAQSLPTVTTVVMERILQKTLDSLKDFQCLERLAMRSSLNSLIFDASTVSRPQQLTHLSICNVMFRSTASNNFLSVVSQFTNLENLVWHNVDICNNTFLVVHSLLTCLPKLTHLSLSVGHRHCTYHSIFTPNPGPLGQAHGLSSLELINCADQSLHEDAVRLVPGLKSLAIFYKYSHQEMLRLCTSLVSNLKTWLSELPQLSTLVIVNGPPVGMYATSIPTTLTRLTLCATELSSEDMAAVSVQVLNLLHLHIDPWPSYLGALTAKIPELFPKLKSLKLRNEHVPEKDFLCLHQLQDLRHLEVLGSQPHISALAGQLQHLTNYRLRVQTAPRQGDVLTCSCVRQVN